MLTARRAAQRQAHAPSSLRPQGKSGMRVTEQKESKRRRTLRSEGVVRTSGGGAARQDVSDGNKSLMEGLCAM